MGRPKKPIDPEAVRKLAERQWNSTQIAYVLGIDRRNLERRFAQVIKDGQEAGRAKLLDVLWQRGVTEKRDRVLIHLADRVLGKAPQKIEMSLDDAIKLLEEKVNESGEGEDPGPADEDQGQNSH